MGTIAIGLGAFLVTLLGGSLLTKKLSDNSSSTASMLEGLRGIDSKEKSFAENYEADSVLTSESNQPYISSNEQARPDDNKESEKKNTFFDNIKEKLSSTGSPFPFKFPSLGTVGTFYVGYKAGDVLGDVAETPTEKKKDFVTLALILGGAFVGYKVFVK